MDAFTQNNNSVTTKVYNAYYIRLQCAFFDTVKHSWGIKL